MEGENCENNGKPQKIDDFWVGVTLFLVTSHIHFCLFPDVSLVSSCNGRSTGSTCGSSRALYERTERVAGDGGGAVGGCELLNVFTLVSLPGIILVIKNKFYTNTFFPANLHNNTSLWSLLLVFPLTLSWSVRSIFLPFTNQPSTLRQEVVSDLFRLSRVWKDAEDRGATASRPAPAVTWLGPVTNKPLKRWRVQRRLRLEEPGWCYVYRCCWCWMLMMNIAILRGGVASWNLLVISCLYHMQGNYVFARSTCIDEDSSSLIQTGTITRRYP